MSADDLDDFWVHTITVETFTGVGQNGDNFAAPVTLSPDNTPPNGVFVDGGQKVARTATGELVVMNAPLFAPIAAAPLFVEKSRVTFNGKQSRVLAVTIHDSGSLDLPDHVEVTLV